MYVILGLLYDIIGITVTGQASGCSTLNYSFTKRGNDNEKTGIKI